MSIIKNIYAEGELQESSTIRKNRIVQTEGKREVEREVSFYNLEIILAIGYRVRSHRGSQFRQWVTARLNEYLVKGFTMDDDCMKEMRNFGEDYFDELDEETSLSSYHGLALSKEGLLIGLFHPHIYAFDLGLEV